MVGREVGLADGDIVGDEVGAGVSIGSGSALNKFTSNNPFSQETTAIVVWKALS
jgi:hypothetical protein